MCGEIIVIIIIQAISVFTLNDTLLFVVNECMRESALARVYTFGPNTTCSISAVDKERKDDGCVMKTQVTVSYTHLDVYKRQLLNSVNC